VTTAVGAVASAVVVRARTLETALDDLQDALAESVDGETCHARLRARQRLVELERELATAPGQPRPPRQICKEITRTRTELLTSETEFLAVEYGAKLRRLYVELALATGQAAEIPEILRQ
jgi:hypothetical protein